MNLKDKHILLTGASRGVGRAIALACAEKGATALLVARDQEALQQVENEITANGGKAASYAIDLTHEEEVVKTIDSIMKKHDSIDVLVNNAGRGSWGSIVDTPVDTWSSVMDVNMKSTFMMCKYVLPHMYERKEGHVVNISSVQAMHPIANSAPYCSSKAAMEAFTKSLYLEAKPYNVKATSIAPSGIDTEFRDHMTNRKPFTQDEKDKMLRPSDVAEAVVGVLQSSPASVPTSLVLETHQQ